jgi:hypothetical protein
MIIFGVLIVDSELLPEHVFHIAVGMPSLYSGLQGLAHPYFDTMTTMIMICNYGN